MIVHLEDFIDREKTKVNITMKDGTEFLGVDLLEGTAENVFGFVWKGVARFVNNREVLYFDLYIDDLHLDEDAD